MNRLNRTATVGERRGGDRHHRPGAAAAESWCAYAACLRHSNRTLAPQSFAAKRVTGQLSAFANSPQATRSTSTLAASTHARLLPRHRVAFVPLCLRAFVPFFLANRFAAAAIAALLLPLSACAGRAHLELISLQHAAIDPPPAATYAYEASECYWWQDDEGDLNIAMQFDPFYPFAPVRPITLQVSFALDGAPVGSGKNYIVRNREIRGVFRAGVERHWFTSDAGICGVTRWKHDRLKGSFRLWMTHHPGPGLFDLFPRQPGPVLFHGTFEAVPDTRGRGRAIREKTESHGWNRPEKPKPPPTTSAASRPES